MTKIIEVQPHGECPKNPAHSIFLAGTIEMGKSDNWQKKLIEALQAKYDNKYAKKLYVFNPRREDWPDDPKELEYQINWELSSQENAELIIMNILGDSKSPISLMELGLFGPKNIQTYGKGYVVACPQEFYRYDNVRVVCERYNIPLYSSFEELVKSSFGIEL